MNARVAKNGGQAFGIVLGCLLGMFPLLFIENERATKDDGPKLDNTEQIFGVFYCQQFLKVHATEDSSVIITEVMFRIFVDFITNFIRYETV